MSDNSRSLQGSPGPVLAEDYYGDGGAYGPPSQASLLDIAVIRGFLWRQRFVLTGVTAIVLLLGYVITIMTQPIYTATASVRIDPQGDGEIVEGQEMIQLRGSDVGRYMDTLAKVLQSRSMAYQVVDRLKLANDPVFMGSPSVDTAKKPKEAAAQREAAAARVRGGLEVDSPANLRIMSISYRSANPAMSAKIANAYVDAFLVDDLRRGFEKNAYAQKYLTDQIAKTRLELQAAERQAISYARANKIVSSSLLGSVSNTGESVSVPQTVTATNLASINAAATAARTKRIASEQRWRSVAGVPAERVPEVQQNSTYQNLVAERAKIASTTADLLTRYGDSYPKIVELKAQIAVLDRQIGRTSADIKDSLRQAFDEAAKEERAIAAELDRVSFDTLDEQDRRVVFKQMDRNVTALSTQLQAMLERYNQISSAANIQPGTITKLDDAVIPGAPSSPNLINNLMLALATGLGLALALAILRDVLDDRLRSVEDVEQKLSLTPLGFTPLVSQGEVGEGSPMLNEAYSSIRTSIDFALPTRQHNVLMLTSSQAGEGKSTTIIALAKRYALLNRKVLLIEADLRKPSFGLQFGSSRPKNGFVEVLLGQCSLEDALIEQDTANLDVLPVGTIPSNPIEVLSSGLISEFIDKYRDQYSMIMFDSPPVMGLADAPILSRLVDGVVFIIESNRAHFGQAKSAVRRLRSAQAVMLGAVLTKYQAREAGETYNYQYSYYTYGSESKR